MNFVSVNSKLAESNNSPTIHPLKILQPSRDPYLALLVQPQGVMQATPYRIGHTDRAAATTLYQDLLNQACSQNVDLVITPEYCIPWQVIEDVAKTELKPKRGALWALGCESITLDKLNEFKTKQAKAGVEVLYETPSSQEKAFLCPLVYIFWVDDKDNNTNICMLVQFKSEPCGGTGELDHLHLGNDLYIFGNGDNELNFFTLICADVFKISPKQIQDHHRNSLIAHIQLNEKSWHPAFSQYRDTLFSVGSNNPTELICLNWATGVKWDVEGNPEKEITWNNLPNSAFYIPKKNFQRCPDSEIDHLHKSGLYFNRANPYWDALFLNNMPQAILVSKQPVRFDGAQALAPIPPARVRCIKRLIPNLQSNSWVESDNANDGFNDLLAEHKPELHSLQNDFSDFETNIKDAHDVSPLAVERSLELLQGPTGNDTSWHNRYELAALEMATDESPRRVTIHQEKSKLRAGVGFRKDRIQAGYEAAILHTQNLTWPIPLIDISHGFKYHWEKEHPHSNVTPLKADFNPATLMYLPSGTSSEVNTQFAKLASGLRKHAIQTSKPADMINNCIRAKDRLCIVYREGHELKFKHEPDGKTSITIPANQSPTSIDNESDHEH